MNNNYSLNSLGIFQLKETQNLIKTLNENLIDSVKTALDVNRLVKSQQEYIKNSISLSTIGLTKSYKSFIKSSLAIIVHNLNEQLLQFKQMTLVDLQPIIEYSKEITTESEESFEDNENVFDLITEDERLEFQAGLENIEVNDNWQLQLITLFANWKDKNPVFVRVICFIITSMIAATIGFIAEPIYKTVKSVIVHEEPKKDSQVVLKLNEDIELKVTGDTPYYFKIEYENHKKIITGWISKRSVKQKQQISK